MLLQSLQYPIIQAPMAGGVSNPILASAVSNAGGLGFLAGGYKTAEAMRQEILEMRKRTKHPFGVNLFVPNEDAVQEEELSAYRKQLETPAHQLGASVGEAKTDDDDWENKLNVLIEEKVPLVSFTFGCPSPKVIQQLKEVGSFVVVTVTTPEEALIARDAGVDALCLQGIEAGGHRATFHNTVEMKEDYSLLMLLRLVRKAVELPLIAAGGIMNGEDIALILTAGAKAVQLGTAFIRTPESGAHRLHKKALADPRFQSTVITRAFTGRPARGLVNKFIKEYDHLAPCAYPQIHYMTKDIRKKAGETNNPDYMSLWAGQGFPFAREITAAELVKTLMSECEQALKRVTFRK